MSGVTSPAYHYWGGGEIGPLGLLRDKEFCNSVYRKRHQDRLNRALGQVDAAGLCAVRPAGFMTRIPPKRGEPGCSIALVPLKWRIDAGERTTSLPFAIEPVLGRSFRPLLPIATPAAQWSRVLASGWMRSSGVVRLPTNVALKLAVESAPPKLPLNGAPLSFIRQALMGVDISAGPHVSYALAHALPASLQPALAMSLRAMSARSAPALTEAPTFEIEIASAPALAARAEDFVAIAPAETAPEPASARPIDFPTFPAPTATRLPLPVRTSLAEPALQCADQACPISYSEFLPAGAALRADVEAPPFGARAEVQGLQLERRLEIEVESAPALAALAEDLAAIALNEIAPNQGCGLATAFPIVSVSALIRLPFPMAAFQPALVLASGAEVRRLSNFVIPPATTVIRTGVKTLQSMAVAAEPRPPVDQGLQIAVESAPELPARTESFTAVNALFPATAETTGSTNADASEVLNLPLEYFCQRSRITPALHAEWTRRTIPRVRPDLPFDKPQGAIDDLLPERDAAKPVFADTAKVENRRWGGRYLELAAAAIVLATVLATGLHIATRVRTEAPGRRRDVAALRVSAAPLPVKPASGPLSQVRSAIAGPATVEISDTFRAGMQAWGHGGVSERGHRRAPGMPRRGPAGIYRGVDDFAEFYRRRARTRGPCHRASKLR